MILLALETSTDCGSVALWRDGALLEKNCPAGVSHSATLLPLVEALLAEAEVSKGALDAIAFGAGPGAFTGLRVACGAAQGLAVGLDRPLLPIRTLDALAYAAGGQKVLALLDARMQEIYFAAYPDANQLAGGAAADAPIRLASPAALPLPDGAGWRAVGNAPAAYPVLAERLQAAGMRWAGPTVPTAAGVAALAAGKFARGEGIDPALAAPLYVRDKVAQTVAERLGQGGRA